MTFASTSTRCSNGPAQGERRDSVRRERRPLGERIDSAMTGRDLRGRRLPGRRRTCQFPAGNGRPHSRNRYIHNKFMLVDPLSEDPLVITGFGQLQQALAAHNDENMLVIHGNKRVADIYFGEFMRVFDPTTPRIHCTRLNGRGALASPEAGYLRRTPRMVARHPSVGQL